MFIKLIKGVKMPITGKIKITGNEMVWRIISSDGKIHEGSSNKMNIKQLITEGLK